MVRRTLIGALVVALLGLGGRGGALAQARHPLSVANEVGRIQGLVYWDFDGDEIYRPGETPLEGSLVTLTQNGQPVDEWLTDEDGTFVFTGLQSGLYVVTLQDPPGWVSVIKALTVEVVADQTTWVYFPVYENDSAARPLLALNHTRGAPGSFFTMRGRRFPPNRIATLYVNGHVIGTVATNELGRFLFILHRRRPNRATTSLRR